MISMRPARLIVASFAALAMILLVNARAYSQDADSGTSVSGTSVDAAWDSAGPAIDESADSADEVLEIPQATCADGSSGPCDPADPTDNDGTAINAPSPSAPPPTVDADTASNAPSSDDWGTLDEYQNQQVYAVPYAVYPYTVAATTGVVNRPQVPASAYIPSSPLTQAARPPLNPGPWMMSPASMSALNRPASSPLMGMSMHSSFAFHH
jgi:hypothetical protein